MVSSMSDALRDPLQEILDHEDEDWCSCCKAWTSTYDASGYHLCRLPATPDCYHVTRGEDPRCNEDMSDYATRERIEVLVKQTIKYLDDMRDYVEHLGKLTEQANEMLDKYA